MVQYLQVLWRTVRREKLYAAINIAGLSIGVACFLILALFLRGEWTYDRYNDKHERIYRLVQEFTSPDGTHVSSALTSHALAPVLAADNPQIEAYVRFLTIPWSHDRYAIRHGNDVYYWRDVYWADDNVFDVFTHKILFGDSRTALKDGSSVAVSETFARRYFGRADVVGESIVPDLGDSNAKIGGPKRITLVFADLPANSHLKFDVLFSGNAWVVRAMDHDSIQNSMSFATSYTYLLMAPGFDPRSWPTISERFFDRYLKKPGRGTWHSWLQPLTATHFQTEVRDVDLPIGNRTYLYGCVAVALFILTVACINYMNLATARATRRARSVAIRKILGASRVSLGLQFLLEAILFALLAVAVAVMIVEVLLRATPLNSLMEQQVIFDLRAEPALIGWLLGLGVLIGTVSGLYPALYLSGWAPLLGVTGRYSAGKGERRVREALVLVQFVISGAMIAATLLMTAQMRFVADKSLGFGKDNRVLVNVHGVPTIEKIPAMRTELLRDRRVVGVAEADIGLVPGEVLASGHAQIDDHNGVLGQLSLVEAGIGEDFTSVMGLKIVAGRDLTRDDTVQWESSWDPARESSDSSPNCLVNESLVRAMGWREPLGKRVEIWNLGPYVLCRVVGVVNDFNFKSLHTAVEPLALYPIYHYWGGVPMPVRPFFERMLVVRLSGEDIPGALTEIKRVVTATDPAHPFDYVFLDESLDRLYKSEQRMLRLIAIFAGLCIFIACLGLFGLAAFTTEQRNREIGTRKVLGASTWQIIQVLSSRTLLLVAIAVVPAGVLAYLAIDSWLSGFAYRAALNPWSFVVAAIATTGVAFTTVALQAMKTASADPVEALREE